MICSTVLHSFSHYGPMDTSFAGGSSHPCFPHSDPAPLDVKERLARLGPSAAQSHPFDLNILRVQHRQLLDWASLAHYVQGRMAEGVNYPLSRNYSISEVQAFQTYCEELSSRIAHHPAQPLQAHGPLTTVLLEHPATNSASTPTASRSSPNITPAPEAPEEASPHTA